MSTQLQLNCGPRLSRCALPKVQNDLGQLHGVLRSEIEQLRDDLRLVRERAQRETSFQVGKHSCDNRA